MKGANGTLRCLAIAVALVVGLETGAAFAQSYDPSQDLPQPTVWQKRIDKFGRGISNILFGWTEIPLTIDEKIKQGKPLTYIVANAPIVGTVKAFMRTGVGVYEVFTFAGTKPERNYEPILEPEYLF
jgi:putative exosortase-associated protein (TIGR04073 family)